MGALEAPQHEFTHLAHHLARTRWGHHEGDSSQSAFCRATKTLAIARWQQSCQPMTISGVHAARADTCWGWQAEVQQPRGCATSVAG